MLGPMDNPHAKIDERILVSQTSKPVSSACEPVPSHHGAEIAAGDKNKDSSSTTEEQQQQKASDVDIDLTHLPHNLRWLRLDPVSHPEEIQNATHAVDLWSGLDSSPDRERARSSFDFELDRSAVAPLAKCDDERNRLLAWPKFAFSEHDHRHHRQHHQRFRSSEPTNDIDRNFMLQLGDKPAFACPSHIHAHTSSDSSASGSSFASLSAYLHDFILQERQRQEEEMRVPSFASPSIAGSVSSEPNLPMRLSSLPISNKNMNSSNVFEDRRCLTPQYSASHLPPIPVNSMCGNGASAVRARQSANYSSAHGLLSFASSSPPALPTITSMPAQWPASPCGSSNIGGESIVQPLTGPPHSSRGTATARTVFIRLFWSRCLCSCWRSCAHSL
ncbi:hypothetical protein K437DRAFT_108579 [Tilletiaria anomala UBC 951]|uniref:Uncharacterized protein n=1 Tax=Tilletiaria anomala (strain ATCC 24038 / CBS 436.72 / UBC 951) TaxID=1037660 RepID=A0A066VXR6_TILAU|nr:uncharacterized protein K437DRAFT_108579 [Tilletiaria anomala UBC 951]KDN46271.1 hypothetical protein K437DRAFT_108579 [Tilletiaria anomala UBC 951]